MTDQINQQIAQYEAEQKNLQAYLYKYQVTQQELQQRNQLLAAQVN